MRLHRTIVWRGVDLLGLPGRVSQGRAGAKEELKVESSPELQTKKAQEEKPSSSAPIHKVSLWSTLYTSSDGKFKLAKQEMAARAMRCGQPPTATQSKPLGPPPHFPSTPTGCCSCKTNGPARYAAITSVTSPDRAIPSSS